MRGDQAGVSTMKRREFVTPHADGRAVPRWIGRRPGPAGSKHYGKIVHRPDLQAKRLELLKEIAPNISRLAVLSNAGIPPAEVALQELKSAAKKLDVDVQPVQISRPNDFYAAFAAIANQRLDALLVFPDPRPSPMRD